MISTGTSQMLKWQMASRCSLSTWIVSNYLYSVTSAENWTINCLSACGSCTTAEIMWAAPRWAAQRLNYYHLIASGSREGLECLPRRRISLLNNFMLCVFSSVFLILPPNTQAFLKEQKGGGTHSFFRILFGQADWKSFTAETSQMIFRLTAHQHGCQPCSVFIMGMAYETEQAQLALQIAGWGSGAGC